MSRRNPSLIRIFSLCSLLALPLFGSSCALLSDLFTKPTVTLKSVDLTSLSFTGIGANIVLQVVNPNAIGLDLAHLSYQITIEGKQLVAGQANQAVNVPANGTGYITIPVSLRFLDFAQSIEAILQKTVVNYTVAVTPGFNTPLGLLDFPLSHSGTFPTPRLPDVSLGTAAVGSVDLMGATVALPLLIHNKNPFALPIVGLSYTVSLAGTQIITAGANPGPVAANQQASVPVSARINFLSAGLGVASAIQANAADIALHGTLDLDGYKMPLNLSTRLGR